MKTLFKILAIIIVMLNISCEKSEPSEFINANEDVIIKSTIIPVRIVIAEPQGYELNSDDWVKGIQESLAYRFRLSNIDFEIRSVEHKKNDRIYDNTTEQLEAGQDQDLATYYTAKQEWGYTDAVTIVVIGNRLSNAGWGGQKFILIEQAATENVTTTAHEMGHVLGEFHVSDDSNMMGVTDFGNRGDFDSEQIKRMQTIAKNLQF